MTARCMKFFGVDLMTSRDSWILCPIFWIGRTIVDFESTALLQTGRITHQPATECNPRRRSLPCAISKTEKIAKEGNHRLLEPLTYLQMDQFHTQVPSRLKKAIISWTSPKLPQCLLSVPRKAATLQAALFLSGQLAPHWPSLWWVAIVKLQKRKNSINFYSACPACPVQCLATSPG